MNKNLKIAHRGYRDKYPENTLLAFEKSLGKCDFIELDIQVTKDYELVVFHDYTLERTTNIKNNKNLSPKGSYNIYDYTLAELKLLDIGSWFDTTLPKQTILTLEEILGFGKQHNIALNIELKDCNYIKDELFIQKLCDTIEKFNITIPLLISSFNSNYLKLLKKSCPLISTALNSYKHPKHLIQYLKELDVCAYHISKNAVDTIPMDDLIKNNIPVSVFTVNDKNLQTKLFQKEIRGVFTDIL